MHQFEKMDFKAFLAELKKQKVNLSPLEQDQWEEYFNHYAAECIELTRQIAATNNEIDNRVFDLYGLTEEEKEIVMNT